MGGEGDADAGADDEVTSGQLDGGYGHGVTEALGDLHALALVDEVLAEDGELVAPEAGSSVSVPQGALETVGHGDQHLVASGVPEAVVDHLEVVEVEEEDSGQTLAPLEAAQREPEPVEEQGPVG